MVANFQALQVVSQTFGLRMEPETQSAGVSTALLWGNVEGTRMEIYQWQGDFLHVYLRAYFTPPLDLGLSLEPAGLADLVGGLLGRHDLQTGHAALDNAFAIHAREADRAVQLFQPTLVEQLLAWKQTGASFQITDEGISLRLPIEALWFTGLFTTREVHTPEHLVQNFRATLALATAVSTAASALPPSPLLAEHAAALRTYAEEHGLTFTPSPLAISGLFGHGHLLVHPKLGRDDVTTTLTLRFAKELPRLLSVRPRRVLDLLTRVGAPGHSVATGDTAFDTAFRLVVSDDGPSVLSEAARRGLLALHDGVGNVELDGRGLTLHAPATLSPAELPAWLDKLLELERLLSAEG